ncbi:hypothetical protein JFJ09_07445 [Pseudoalteromonas arctica]|uniref:hypothetical protein n=1 Tax=Pseudoalteromonas arctica TaxID=394751 RepID=UPI001C9D0519|nr:hypothetical protein [Pseudoalteromonas arctica]MBZ2192049.1 hypothetical protein [Pseudoalteromonas arctica]
MTTNADVMNELANAAQSATALTQEVGDKVADINTAIGQLNNAVNSAIENVNAAIPNAVKSQMSQVIHLDENNGDDDNDGALTRPKATFKECINSMPGGSSITVRVLNGSDLTINEGFTIQNKKINIRSMGGDNSMKLIVNAGVEVNSSTISAYYRIKELIQSSSHIFKAGNSSIEITASKITLSENAACFFTATNRPALDSPGGFVSKLSISHAAIDSSLVTSYKIFNVEHYNSMILAMYKDLVLTDNVEITSDEYTSQRIGTENIYILGA